MVEKESYLEQLKSGDTNKDLLAKAEKDLERHEIILEIQVKENKLHKREYDIVSKAPKPIKLVQEYQELGDYWVLQDEYRAINRQRQVLEDEDSLLRIRKVVDAKREEVKRLKGDLK